MRLLEERLGRREAQGLLRHLVMRASLIDFTSNDYFGFAKQEKSLRGFSGSTGSRLLTGNSSLCEVLEEELATFHKAEAALIYTSGYMANLGLLTALGTEEVTFCYDLEIHASMIDGMSLSDAKKIPFRHNDLNSLEERLKIRTGETFVLVESLYSMSGDLAPLQEMVALCRRYGAELIVDEAHATGLFGPKGEGRVVELGLEKEVFARLHTFSKALGCHGAAILGTGLLKKYLLNFSRQQIYTTALPESVLLQIQARYKKLQLEAEQLQKRLFTNISYCQKLLSLPERSSPIQPLYISGIDRLRALSCTLEQKGMDLRPILPPTVRRGKESLRLVLHSFNTQIEIDQLAGALSCVE